MVLSGSQAGPQERYRFRAEAEAVARLRHPNIVQIYEVGEHDGLPFFALEFCPGGSLAGQLDGKPWAAGRAAELIETLARAVHAAHQARLVHRDLKPANVLLAADGTPKVTDFGLAKKLDEAGQTRSGVVMGTPEYMAPEQAKNRLVNERTDIYNFGATMYRLVTMRLPPCTVSQEDGGLPIDAKTWQKLLKPVEEQAPDCPKALADLIHRCLSYNAHKRPERASEVQGELARLTEELVQSPEDRLEMLEW
jgi:eukaryotic-like serine/threonine-protein kinase